MLNKWITDGTGKPFYARKEISVKKEIVSATAYVCGLGQFNFYINGQKVDDHILDPAWTAYNKYVQYVRFDVKDYLENGMNAIGAEVGNGWYIMMNEHYSFHFPPFMPPNPNPYKPYNDKLILSIKVVIEYEDGTAEEFDTDDSYKVCPHPIVMTNVYSSETMYGNMVQHGWNKAGFDDSDWANAFICDGPEGVLEEQTQPPIRVIKEYEAEYLHNVCSESASDNIREIWDFSQNMSAIIEFEVKGKAGDEIRLYPAEKLDEKGDVDQMAKNWVLIDNQITYIIGNDDVWEKYTMTFTYFASRFVGVEGASFAADNNKAQIRNLKAYAISSATKRDGDFTCDDERYNRIYDLVEKAVEANMLSVHTDCPTIERFAWQEENNMMAPSIMFMKDVKGLWGKFLRDERAEQHTAEDWFNDLQGGKYYPGDGLVPSQSPCYIPNVLPVPGLGDFYDIIPWGSASILGTYWHYMFYGDKKIIEDNYDMGMRYLKHLKAKVTEDGFINHGLGDWGNPKNLLLKDNIETAFLYADVKTLKWFAEILGKTEDIEELEAYRLAVLENYNSKLFVKHPEKGYMCYRSWEHKDEIVLSQAAEALPLYWGMVPPEYEADVAQALRDILEEDGSFLSGEVGQAYIMQSASKYGMNDLICKFITKEEHPSYYAFVLEGLTALGEFWAENPRSQCHDMLGHIIEWYYNGIAGIKLLEPGFSKILIKPYMPESMNEFKCSYNSVKGKIEVCVKRKECGFDVSFTVPEGVEYDFDNSLLK